MPRSCKELLQSLSLPSTTHQVGNRTQVTTLPYLSAFGVNPNPHPPPRPGQRPRSNTSSPPPPLCPSDQTSTQRPSSTSLSPEERSLVRLCTLATDRPPTNTGHVTLDAMQPLTSRPFRVTLAHARGERRQPGPL
jgi:hypothetical protein